MNYFRRPSAGDLAAEFKEHLLERTEELIDSGMSRGEAEAQARREFGNMTATLEQSREAWTLPSIESLLKDVSYGVRTLRKRPLFAAAVALTLALGIGANAAIFGLIDGLWFHPLGVPRPGEITRVFSVSAQDREGMFSYPEYRDMAAGANAFRALAACGGRGVRIKHQDGTHELLLVNVVSDNFFDALEVHAATGRVFQSANGGELQHGVVAVLGYTFWQRHFGGNSGAIGQTLRVEHGGNDVLLTIIGVLPPDFREIQTGSDRDLWIPASGAAQLYSREGFEARDARWFRVIGRLAPGASVDLARAQAKTIAAQFARQWPAINAGRGATAVSDLAYRLNRAGANGIALISVAILVALLCCLNVANLLLARNVSRRAEFALRLALGASRSRLARQLMTENALLGMAGLALGLTLGYGLIQLLPALFVPAPGFVFRLHFAFDARVILFCTSIALGALFVFGLAPALRAARVDPAPTLKDASGGAGGYRVRRWLVISQIGISLILLAGSGALLESLANSRSSRSGYPPRPLLIAWLGGTSHLNRGGFDGILERLKALPGVKEIAFAIRSPLSLSGGGYAQRVVFPGNADPRLRNPIEVKFNAVSSNFLPMMGVPVLRGRCFDPADQVTGPPTVVVNERMAQQFWPHDDAIDKTIRLADSNNAEYRVIGIVANTPINDVGEPPEPYMYLPFWRNPAQEATLIINASGDAAALAPAVRRALVSIDPRLDPFTITTFVELLRNSTSLYQLAAQLVTSLGILALLITAVGLYGVTSFSVSRRSREIGIRMALGAERGQTLALVLREAASLGAWGILIGVPSGAIAIRLAASVLFGVGVFDVKAFLCALPLLAVVLFVAVLAPARRAASIDPVAALRDN